MEATWSDIAYLVNSAKRTVGDLLTRVEREEYASVQLRLRSLVQWFDFHINLFLRVVGDLPDGTPALSFCFWFARLDEVCAESGEIHVANPALARECLGDLALARERLGSALSGVLSSRLAWPSDRPLSHPVCSMVRAKRILDVISASLRKQYPGQHEEQLYDDHIWGFAEFLYPDQPHLKYDRVPGWGRG